MKWHVSDVLDDGHNGIVTEDYIVIGAASPLTLPQATRIVKAHNNDTSGYSPRGAQFRRVEMQQERIAELEKALEPFAKKTGIRSYSVVLMRKEVINARKALGWENPLAHGGKDDTKNSSCR